MTDLSVTIIVLNEEKNLDSCLKCLQSLDAEIVLVDSGSTDETLEIAKRNGVKIYKRRLDNFAKQKNWAISKSTRNWILSVDADEIITEELTEEIKLVIQENLYDGFLIPRRNFILGGEIKHSRWSPDKHIWLWKKDMGRWEGEVHEEVVIKGKLGQLKNCKLHYSHKTLSAFFQSNNLYSTLLAQSFFKKGFKFSLLKMFWNSFFEFNIRFFYKLGFLDGWRGFVLAYSMAIYQLMVWVKLWELEQDK